MILQKFQNGGFDTDKACLDRYHMLQVCIQFPFRKIWFLDMAWICEAYMMYTKVIEIDTKGVICKISIGKTEVRVSF